MSDNVVNLFNRVAGPVEGLRAIADKMESGELSMDRVTLVTGGEVFHLGTDDLHAAQAAVFDLNLGLTKMMAGALSLLEPNQ